MDESFIPGTQTAALQALLAGMDAYLEAFPTVAEGLSASDLVAETRAGWNA